MSTSSDQSNKHELKPTFPVNRANFYLCNAMTAVCFFIVGGLVAEALCLQQARHLHDSNNNSKNQSNVTKP